MPKDTTTELTSITPDINIQLPQAKPEYKSMLANIQEKAPAIAQASSNFYKSHSQMMSVTLDVTAITPIRSIKHTLAEIEKTKAQAASSRGYVEGAVRKLNFFTNQYDNLMKKIGKDELTEEDYELEEIKYHIMTCMKQALNSARPRNGVIDEGNMIYLFDLGINAAQAQAEVFSYLQWENEIIKQGKAPEHHHTVQWLEACAEKWAHCPGDFANSRGFNILDKTSLTNTPQLEDKTDGS